MSRRKAATKREILPDSKYGNLVVAKCINVVMWDGKKEVAENIVYGAMDKLKKIAKDGDELAAFFTNDVLPRGAYPFFRVGNQPYGILPACDIRYLKFPEKLEMLRAIQYAR